MSVAAATSLPRRPVAQAPRPYQWRVDEFQRARESGLWDGQKVLLIDGELIEMPAAKPPHDIALLLADYLFKKIFSRG